METKPTHSCTFINIPFASAGKWLQRRMELDQPISRCIRSYAVRNFEPQRPRAHFQSELVELTQSAKMKPLHYILAYVICFDGNPKANYLFDRMFVILPLFCSKHTRKRDTFKVFFFLFSLTNKQILTKNGKEKQRVRKTLNIFIQIYCGKTYFVYSFEMF